MRISDWSSDVCSSDLRDRSAVADHRGGRVRGVPRAVRLRQIHLAQDDSRARDRRWWRDPYRRASCRSPPAGRARRGDGLPAICALPAYERSEEHTSELQSLMRISYAVFCLKKKKI